MFLHQATLPGHLICLHALSPSLPPSSLVPPSSRVSGRALPSALLPRVGLLRLYHAEELHGDLKDSGSVGPALLTRLQVMLMQDLVHDDSGR